MRRLVCVWLAAVVVMSCGGGEGGPSPSTIGAADDGAVNEVETFCAAVVPLLLEEPEGTDGPAGPVDGVASQMQVISEEGEVLTNSDRDPLLAAVDQLSEDLDAARLGEAENGWSSVPVVKMIGSLCDSNDLIG